MTHFCKLLLGAAILPVCLNAQELPDTAALDYERELDLNEVVVVANRPVMKHTGDGILYMVKNDPYAKGMNVLEVLDRVPRVSVVNEQVSIAGKASVRYILNGHLLDMADDALAARLRNLPSSAIEKIEVLTTPPAKYAAEANVAFISITTKNESLGTRGSLNAGITAREKLSYSLGANLSHTTRRVELSADANWSDNKGINDLDRTFEFADRVKQSERRTRFTNRMFAANALFKYKFSDRLSAGAIINFSTTSMSSRLKDVTTDNGEVSESTNHSPSRPNNAVTATAFADWLIDPKGKMLSLTYNYFNRYSRTFSDVTTMGQGPEAALTDDGVNRYHIHSVKWDATLPFGGVKVEAGAAFTSIGNRTGIDVNNLVDGEWIPDLSQSNDFEYSEKTVAVYASAESAFSEAWRGKIGLRYEHTDSEGKQRIGEMAHAYAYGYLFPSVNLSWNSAALGRFAIAYSMGISRPAFADLNPFRYYTTATDYFSGNPDLRPSVSHNAEINYSFKGVYAVLYNSYNRDVTGYVTRFNPYGGQYTLPENCIDNNKTGLYASYFRTLTGWWNLKTGAEVFHISTKSRIPDFLKADDNSWSGKLELNSSWMLNSRKSLILSVRFSHYFPFHDRMTRYDAVSLLGFDVRYMLLDGRLTLSASVNDPFGWNITRYSTLYDSYTQHTRNNIHSHAVSLRVVYNFGGNKVNNAYRDSKERESHRAY